MRTERRAPAEAEAIAAAPAEASDLAAAPGESVSPSCNAFGAFGGTEGALSLCTHIDLLALVDWLDVHLSPALSILLALPGGEIELIGDCEAALSESIGGLRERWANLRVQLADGHAAACTSLLAPVRAIASSYRMTGKVMPTRSSFFVGGVLKPWHVSRGVLGTWEAQVIPEGSGRDVKPKGETINDNLGVGSAHIRWHAHH